MSRDHWYRNTSWTAAIEASFRQRLGRAREKLQYLRIQASCLVESEPNVALDLLREYFHLAGADDFDMNVAHVHRARALLTLGRIEEALQSYEAAIAFERLHPYSRTNSLLDYVGLVLERKREPLYVRALELLESRSNPPLLPIDQYREYGARALLLDHFGRCKEARSSAIAAILAAEKTQSGFRYHKNLGLVPTGEDDFRLRVTALAN